MAGNYRKWLMAVVWSPCWRKLVIPQHCRLNTQQSTYRKMGYASRTVVFIHWTRNEVSWSVESARYVYDMFVRFLCKLINVSVNQYSMWYGIRTKRPNMILNVGMFWSTRDHPNHISLSVCLSVCLSRPSQILPRLSDSGSLSVSLSLFHLLSYHKFHVLNTRYSWPSMLLLSLNDQISRLLQIEQTHGIANETTDSS